MPTNFNKRNTTNYLGSDMNDKESVVEGSKCKADETEVVRMHTWEQDGLNMHQGKKKSERVAQGASYVWENGKDEVADVDRGQVRQAT